MPALRKRFLLHLAAQAHLTESGRVRRELVDRTAGTLSLAMQYRHELPRRTKLRTATIPLLECPVAQFLQVDPISPSQDIVGQLPVQALAVLGLLAVQFCQPLLVRLLAAAHHPAVRSRQGLTPFAHPALAAFGPHPAVRRVVVGVVGPPLPLDLPLQHPDLGIPPFQSGGKQPQRGVGLAHDRDRLRPDVQADGPLPKRVLRFLVRAARTHQLDIEAAAPVQLAAHDPHELDWAGQAVPDDRIICRYDRFEGQLAAALDMPDHLVVLPAQAGGIGLAFHRVELALAFEARPALLSQQVVVDRPKGPASHRLHHQRVEMIPQIAVPKLFGPGMQVILTKADCLAGLAEGSAASLAFQRLWLPCLHLPGGLIPGRPAQGLPAPQRFSQAGVVHLPGSFQPFEHDHFLRRADRQWDLGDESGRLAPFHSSPFLVLDVLFDDFQRRSADRADKKRTGPQRQHMAFEDWELLPQQPGTAPFQLLDQPVDPELWIHLHQQVYVIGHDFHFYHGCLQLKRSCCDDLFQTNIDPLTSTRRRYLGHQTM